MSSKWASYIISLFEGLRAELGGQSDAELAIIYRRTRIESGRMRIYYEVALFGDNPFVLERLGSVLSELDRPEHLNSPNILAAIGQRRYCILDPSWYTGVQEAQLTWQERGYLSTIIE